MRGEFSLKYKYAIERTAHTDLTDSDRISTYDMTYLWIYKDEHRLNLLFSFYLKYEGDIPFGSLYTICIMLCPHIHVCR